MSKQSTVVEQKQLFLQARKQFLSRGIPPSERLRTIADDHGIELSVLKGVVDKGLFACHVELPCFWPKLIVQVNRELKQHARKVYSRQMIEHAVEQIDALYWAAGAQQAQDAAGDTSNEGNDDPNVLCQGHDLTLDENIAKLPAVWPAVSHDNAVDQDDYLQALSRLQALSARRQALQNRLNSYHTLLTLLEPYRKPKENIQPNLVWKDSPLAPDLGKLRSLALRVAARVGERWGNVQVPATAEEDGEDRERVDMSAIQSARRKKADRVLADW